MWLLHAGCRTGVSEAFYRRSVHGLDWGRFYDECDGYSFIEWLRTELEKDVDFVLLDSRTGETEMGGVCTQHLADVVVVMFAPNDSNLQGAKRIAELLQTDRVKDLRGPSRPLMVLPIPSRVDTQGETAHLARFERKFRDTFEKLSYKSLDWCWDSKIRYVSTYSYEESNVMFGKAGHRDLRQAYERIGEEILRLHEERLSPQEREYQARARSTTRQGAQEGTERAQSTIQQLISTGRAKIDAGDFKTASSLLSSAVTLAKQDFGEEHPDTLSAMNNLAATLYAQGDLRGARQLNEQILEIHRRVLGLEHPDTLASMNNLAEMLRAQGDLAGARKLQEEALEIRRGVLGLCAFKGRAYEESAIIPRQQWWVQQNF
jgi:tetratricopeptide (TPR) repeat protein